jgi:glycogen synthase
MQVCLIAPARSEAGEPGYSSRRLASLLAREHEVTVIHSGAPEELPQPLAAAGFREAFAALPPALSPLKFACGDHRHAAAVMETLRVLYPGRGPDYVEVCDFRAHALVALQARRTGDPLLASTTFAVRVGPTSELLNLHDRRLRQPGNQRVAELEREQLRLADLLVWPGGDCLDLYRRYYGDLELPPPARIPHPFVLPQEEPRPWRAAAGPLRLLFLGELRRSKGVFDLVEACWLLPAESWHLTFAGADTDTATMGQSVRATVEAMCGDDPRIEFTEPLRGARLAQALARADLVVVPSQLEVSATAALVAMAAGVPVLATPVGELTEVVEPGVSGWLADDVGPAALAAALAKIDADREELERLRGGDGPRERAAELADPAPLLAGYEEILGRVVPRRAPQLAPAEPPLVTGVIPYHRAHEYVQEAVESLLAQTHPRIEVLIVNDGSFAPADSVLDELAADPRVRVVSQMQAGEGRARTLGAVLARGEYLVMLDADNVLEPEFVERALLALRLNPGLAYVTCWLRMIDGEGRDTSVHPGYAPLGNSVLGDEGENWDGDTLAMLPRSVFSDRGFEFHREGSMHSDWQLYRWMRRRGAYGAVIPERLARYRVLGDSMSRAYANRLQERSWNESLDWIQVAATRWTAEASG